MADAAVGVLGKVAAHLAWPQYRQLLGQFLRSLQRNADSKVLSFALPGGFTRLEKHLYVLPAETQESHACIALDCTWIE